MKIYKVFVLGLIAIGLVLSTPVAEAKTVGVLDLIFVIDLTGSMGDDIEEVQEQASDIVEYISDNIPSWRIAIVGYRDFGEPVMFEDYAFSSNREDILDNINDLSVYGGGDWPEAVYEGLMRAIMTEEIGDWRDGVHKKIILMGDAPPHEKEDGSDYIYDIDDVAEAAYNVDPANIYSIVIGDDADAARSFEMLAEKTSGKFLTAAEAEDVPLAIMEALEDIKEDVGGKNWWRIGLIILAVLGVITAIIVAIVFVIKKK